MEAEDSIAIFLSNYSLESPFRIDIDYSQTRKLWAKHRNLHELKNLAHSI